MYLRRLSCYKGFPLCSWLLSYDLSKISAKLAIHLKHKLIFASVLEILLGNNVTSSVRHIRKSFQFIFYDLLLKALSHETFFKNALEKFNVTRFQGINEINRNHHSSFLIQVSVVVIPCVFIFLWLYAMEYRAQANIKQYLKQCNT